ncbi:MAG: hypothetical protein LC745_07030 [Planctomycetia bacterium]|nr:hypothetical protein [Planctomycetia bacterium]
MRQPETGGPGMVRFLRWPGVAVVGLAILASAAVPEAAPDASPAGPTGRVVRVALKQKTARKKTRGKRATAAEDGATPPGGATPAAGDTATAATGEGLKFSRDIAPILVANCGDCHMKAAKNGGNFEMASFKKLMEGSPKKKKVIIPGKPEESHLVLQIKGEEDPKMPRGNNRNLSEEAVGKIEQWVKAGALLDKGMDENAPLASYASSPEDARKAELAKLTPEQRDKQVEAVGLGRWKKASSKSIPEVTPGKHFMLFSTLPRARAAAAVKKLDDQYEAARSLVGPAALDWGGESPFRDPPTLRRRGRPPGRARRPGTRLLGPPQEGEPGQTPPRLGRRRHPGRPRAVPGRVIDRELRERTRDE